MHARAECFECFDWLIGVYFLIYKKNPIIHHRLIHYNVFLRSDRHSFVGKEPLSLGEDVLLIQIRLSAIFGAPKEVIAPLCGNNSMTVSALDQR